VQERTDTTPQQPTPTQELPPPAAAALQRLEQAFATHPRQQQAAQS
jgi:hypothetical protein